MSDEVTVIENGKVGAKAATDLSLRDLSVQRRSLPKDDPRSVSPIFWFGTKDSDNDIARWWSEERERDLDTFLLREGNDILQGAVSSMVKKFKSMNWVIEGPQRVVNRYQQLLLESEFWQGWGTLISKTLQDYLTKDKGAFWELLGEGDIFGEIVGPVLGIVHLDSRLCQLTGDIEFPVIYHNSKTERAHKLHVSRVVHLVDMPSPREAMLNVGFCAVSRVIGSSQILLKVNTYKNEKLDDLPEAGLLLLNNILPEKWNDATANYTRERRKLNQQHWTNIMSFFGVDPAQPATADFISFSSLPDAFNELETTNLYANIVALAFGVDVREFWPISGGSLGTATESQVMHQKARGKGVGDIIAVLERALNWKVLPPSVTFSFDFKDDEEDLLSAEIDKTRTDTIMSMWKPGDVLKGEAAPVSAVEIRQMLADNVSYFDDDFLIVDITEETEATDEELAKMFGPVISVDREGNMKRIRKSRKILIEDAVSIAESNYLKGQITAEQVAEFALAELTDLKRAEIE